MAMVSAVPAISQVLLVAFIFYYMFAVMGVYLLAGKFDGCYSDGNILDPYYLVPSGNINKSW
jgi:hypothetical protein